MKAGPLLWTGVFALLFSLPDVFSLLGSGLALWGIFLVSFDILIGTEE